MRKLKSDKTKKYKLIVSWVLTICIVFALITFIILKENFENLDLNNLIHTLKLSTVSYGVILISGTIQELLEDDLFNIRSIILYISVFILVIYTHTL